MRTRTFWERSRVTRLESGEIRHQVYLEQYKSGRANRVVALLDSADRKIAEEIRKTSGVNTKKRYKEIGAAIKKISKELKGEIDEQTDIEGIVEYEMNKQKSLLSDSISIGEGLKADFVLPSAGQVMLAAEFKPAVMGMTYQSYLEGIESGLYNVWDSAVRTGFITGRDTRSIVRDVLGSVSGDGKLAERGAIRAFRNSVYGNTRTMLQSFANAARMAVYEKNNGLFDGYKWLATLDRRTCPICGGYDGKIYKNLKDIPEIPVHRGCRCVTIPYFADAWESERAAEGGAVSEKVTYKEWLAGQDDDVQREVLGKSRYGMYKKGADISDFVENGKILTLKELNEKLSRWP